MIRLILECDRLGHSLTMVGDNIRVENIAQLPEGFKNKIMQNKPMIIEALKKDCAARSAGLIIGKSGLLYMWTVSHSSTAFMEYTGEQWEVWRETYRPGSKKANNVKTIVQGDTFDYVLVEFKKYIDYVSRKRSERDVSGNLSV